MDLYRRVDEAIQRGEVWRAKEILRGNIGSGSYDSQLYERYGVLLMELGELVEAGKYLFLSGRRRPEYDQAIGVYLSRHPANRPEILYRSFPAAARFREIHRYPLEVRRTLEERGLPEHFAELDRKRIERHKRNSEQRHGQAYLREVRHDLGGFRAYYGLGGHPSTRSQQFIRILGQGLLGAVSLFLAAATVVGMVSIVRWVASLT